MNKIVQSLLLAAKAIGINPTEEELKKFEAIEIEGGDDLVLFLDGVNNRLPEFAGEQKKAARAELYNSMDETLNKKLELLKDEIGEEKYNRIKSTQGVAKLGMLADDMAEALATVKKARQTGSSQDNKAANDQILELTKKLGEMENSTKTALETQEKEITSRFQSKLMNEALFTKLSSVKDIASEYAKEEIIRGVMIPKVQSLAKSKKLNLTRGEDGFELLKEDGTPLVADSKHYTVDDLLLEATRDYARKSDGGGTQGTYDPGGKGQAGAGGSVADAWQAEAMSGG
jgi:Sec-independent protein translocase protein TatA